MICGYFDLQKRSLAAAADWRQQGLKQANDGGYPLPDIVDLSNRRSAAANNHQVFLRYTQNTLAVIATAIKPIGMVWT